MTIIFMLCIVSHHGRFIMYVSQVPFISVYDYKMDCHQQDCILDIDLGYTTYLYPLALKDLLQSGREHAVSGYNFKETLL